MPAPPPESEPAIVKQRGTPIAPNVTPHREDTHSFSPPGAFGPASPGFEASAETVTCLAQMCADLQTWDRARGGTDEVPGYDRSVATALYDGVADWYDRNFPPSAEVTDAVRRFAGRGPGQALDLGCG